MKLTDNFIQQNMRRIEKWKNKRKKKDPMNSSHLFLDNKSIDKIELSSNWSHVSSVYLRKNKLRSTEGVENFLNVTHLYLEKNQISKMTSFRELKNLKKLYLGLNCISVIEGLDESFSLQLLHVQNQNLPPGGMLYFDPQCVLGLQNNLVDLNISGNNLTTLTEFKGLRKVEKLNATDNSIELLTQLCEDLFEWDSLKRLDLRGNPVTNVIKFREKVIASSNLLEILNDKEITELSRNFIQNLERRKKVKRSSVIEFSKDIKSLAEHLPLGIRDSIAIPTSQTIKAEFASTINVSLPKVSMGDGRAEQGFPKRKKLIKQSSKILTKNSSGLAENNKEQKIAIDHEKLLIRK